mmetsp:Transcript_76658/g.150279  ORF Transcript_76658/g.150279 Transcript_76658/m.150279 type:complete len:212 (-) Transcript_76658:1788-2423(-)
MTSTVRFLPRAVSASCTPLSVTESKAEVASSRSTTGGFLSSARAMATRCFSPPDSFSPRSPTIVSHPSGSALMNSRICAPAAASSTSCMSASSRPYSTLCLIVSLNSTVSCGTTPMVARREVWVTPFVSRPPTLTLPPLGSMNRNSRRPMVVFPAPVVPTMAVVVPGGTSKLTSSSPRPEPEGYLKHTLLKLTPTPTPRCTSSDAINFSLS